MAIASAEKIEQWFGLLPPPITAEATLSTSFDSSTAHALEAQSNTTHTDMDFTATEETNPGI